MITTSKIMKKKAINDQLKKLETSYQNHVGKISDISKKGFKHKSLTLWNILSQMQNVNQINAVDINN